MLAFSIKLAVRLLVEQDPVTIKSGRATLSMAVSQMSFEDDIARFNEYYFFREFTFSENTFRPTPTEEVELADNVVWLDNSLFVYQLKERQAPRDTSSENEQRWFERKVLGTATRQIRDPLNYLQEHSSIQLQNHRGHAFNITVSSLDSVHKLVLYKAHESLSEFCKKQKHHKSQTAGLIHLIPANDYLGILKTLLTPAEVADYLVFREALINVWEEKSLNLPEQALVGQYLSGNSEQKPDIQFVEYLQALAHRAEEWDMSRVINVFPDRVTTDNVSTDYYYIVREIAKLKRSELREFKKRFQLSMEKARANEFVLPYRMTIPRTGCGFVFIPLTQDFLAHRIQSLQNLTYAHKHEQKLSKCIGVSFAPEEGGWYSVEWCYLGFPWREDPEMESRLRQNNPFRDVRTVELSQYTFDGSGARPTM